MTHRTRTTFFCWVWLRIAIVTLVVGSTFPLSIVYPSQFSSRVEASVSDAAVKYADQHWYWNYYDDTAPGFNYNVQGSYQQSGASPDLVKLGNGSVVQDTSGLSFECAEFVIRSILSAGSIGGLNANSTQSQLHNFEMNGTKYDLLYVGDLPETKGLFSFLTTVSVNGAHLGTSVPISDVNASDGSAVFYGDNNALTGDGSLSHVTIVDSTPYVVEHNAAFGPAAKLRYDGIKKEDNKTPLPVQYIVQINYPLLSSGALENVGSLLNNSAIVMDSPAPYNGSNLTSGVTLAWQPVTGAKAYEVAIYDVHDNLALGVDTTATTASVGLSGDPYGHYEYFVRPISDIASFAAFFDSFNYVPESCLQNFDSSTCGGGSGTADQSYLTSLALGVDPSVVSSVSFGASDPTGSFVFTTPAAGFPTIGSDYLALSSGCADLALTPNNGITSCALNGLKNSQGNDLTRMTLVLNVPPGSKSWSVDFKFLSEEYPEFVGSAYNDAFLIEQGSSNSTIVGNQVIAPNNVAFDSSGQRISIDTTGVLGMTAADAAGTTYGGATKTLTTSAPIADGATTLTLVFSVMDLGDSVYDTTVFLDNFRFSSQPVQQPGTQGGTIAGAVYGKSIGLSNALSNAYVQVCQSGGTCTATLTDSLGNYSATGLAAGQYVVTAFPPSGSTLLQGSIGPLTLSGAQSLSGQNIVLNGPSAPPVGTTITNIGSGAGGLPIVYWQSPEILTTTGCANGTASFQIVLGPGSTGPGTVAASGAMTETPPGFGSYTASFPQLYPNHGNAAVSMTISCPNVGPTTKSFNIYIDPSGTVVDQNNNPIPNAMVTLYRSDSLGGTFSEVPQGSSVMSIANQNNPDTTDSSGRFGWDVVAGYYIVRASAAGCSDPNNGANAYVSSPVLTIPPAATNVTLQLNCPDIIPPTTQATLTPAPNAAGWNNGPVALTLNAMDNQGGSGVRSITYSATGAQPITSATVNGATATLQTITAPGVTTLAFNATDNANNAEATITLPVRIDSMAPTCNISVVAGPPKQAIATVLDGGSGLAAIQVTESNNATYAIAPFNPGTTSSVAVTFTKVNQSLGAQFALIATDQAGNSVTCDPADVTVDRTTGKPIPTTIEGIQGYERSVTIQNGTPGLTNLDVTVNGKHFSVTGLADGATTTLDIGSALKAGANNTILLMPKGKPGGSATVLIWGNSSSTTTGSAVVKGTSHFKKEAPSTNVPTEIDQHGASVSRKSK